MSCSLYVSTRLLDYAFDNLADLYCVSHWADFQFAAGSLPVTANIGMAMAGFGTFTTQTFLAFRVWKLSVFQFGTALLLT
jgi:hypothetical protein